MANIRWLLNYAKHVKGAIAITTVVFISMNISYIGIISIQQKIIDEIFVAGHYERLSSIMLLFGSIVIIHVLCHMFGAYAYVGATKRLNNRISGDLMRLIHKQSIQVFQKERVAKYVHHFSSDIPAISIFTTTHIPAILGDITSIAFLIYLIGSANISLVFIVGIVSLIYAVIAYFFQPHIKNKSREVQDNKSEHLIVVEEGISSTREVLAFHRVDWEKERYNKKFERYFASIMGQGKLMNKQLFVSEPVKWGMILLILGFGGYLVIIDQMTIGMFVVLYGFSNRFMHSFHSLFESLMDIAKHFGYAERLRILMDREQINEGDLPLYGNIEEGKIGKNRLILYFRNHIYFRIQ